MWSEVSNFISAQLAVLRAQPWIWSLFASAVGACLASFIGLVVDRLPHSRKWRTHPIPGVNLATPSHCDSCGHRLGFVALIPIFGWLFHRGRCQFCAAPVPGRYPMMELIVAILSGVLATEYGPTEASAVVLLGLWLSVAIGWIDWNEGIIPDDMQFALVAIGLVGSPLVGDLETRLFGMLASGASIILAFAYLSIRHRANLFAFGDVKLFTAIGAWTGPCLLINLAIATLISYAAVHIYLMATRTHWRPGDEAVAEELGNSQFLPLGPAVAFGFIFTLLVPLSF